MPMSHPLDPDPKDETIASLRAELERVKADVKWWSEEFRTARSRADVAESQLRAAREALASTRYWGADGAPATWCWCDEPCEGRDYGCQRGREVMLAALAPTAPKEKDHG